MHFNILWYIANMNKELEDYFNNYFELFRSEGWQQLISELDSNKMIINNLEATKDEQDLFFKKGQLNVIGTILNWQSSVNNAYEEQLLEDD